LDFSGEGFIFGVENGNVCHRLYFTSIIDLSQDILRQLYFESNSHLGKSCTASTFIKNTAVPSFYCV
jgi:hypothetical protein